MPLYVDFISFSRPSTGTSQIENVVTENDLEHLLNLLESKDGEMGWQSMMERSTPNMAYQAWRHEPEVQFDLGFGRYVLSV